MEGGPTEKASMAALSKVTWILKTLCQLSSFNIQGHIEILLKCTMQFETKKN